MSLVVSKPKKTKQQKRDWIHTVSEWGVSNHGIPLYVNAGLRQFNAGCSLDVEDDESGGFVGIGIYDGEACYYWSDWELAKQLTLPKFVAHNGASDIAKLKKWGFKVDDSFLVWDTFLMAHVIDSSRRDYSLENLSKLDLGISQPKYEDITGSKKSASHVTLDKLPVELVAEYNALQTFTTFKLYKHQLQQINSKNEEMHYCRKIEQPVSTIFRAMESRGIRIDLDYLKELKEHLEEQKQPIEESIKNELGDINLNSPKQLLEALNGKGITPEFKGKPSTDKRALSIYQNKNKDPLLAQLLEFSELETLLSSFVNPYLERGQEIAHPWFNQAGTRTGRPSCSNPNLLQIPKRTDNGKLVRRMFIARVGYLFGDCDYGQIEPRIMAHLSKDKAMCLMFNSGVKFHDFTNERMKMDDYDKAKVLNLSVGYRATFKSVAQQLKCSDHQAQKEIDTWWGMFPGLRYWQDKLIWQSKKDGYCTTLMGRRIKIEGLNEYNKWKREAAVRQLLNNIIQGSASEIMKLAMIKVDEIPQVFPLIQVYDQLVFEVKNEAMVMVVKETMEKAVKLDVPLVVEAKSGLNWAEVK